METVRQDVLDDVIVTELLIMLIPQIHRRNTDQIPTVNFKNAVQNLLNRRGMTFASETDSFDDFHLTHDGVVAAAE